MGEISVRGVTKRFGKNLVLDNISLKIPAGKITGIIGISGCGKSTLLKMLIGYYKPTKGDIFYNEKRIEKNMRDVRNDFGFASQDRCFYYKLTVEENLRYFGTMYGLKEKILRINLERILKLLQLTDVKNKIAENLSGGMQKRLDLGCALINFPKILILDEPIEDLDPSLRKEMVQMIKKVNSLGTTIIITSHLLWEMEHLCDEFAVIHKGKILGLGDLAKLRDIYGKQNEVFVEFKGKGDPREYDGLVTYLGGSKTLRNYSIDDGQLRIYADADEKYIHKIVDFANKYGKIVIKAGVKKPDLSEVFESLTGKKEEIVNVSKKD